jgi:hypothetical protein
MKRLLSNRERQQAERERRMKRAERKGTREGKSICRADSPEIGREKGKG